jgi:hypothetical protein
VVSEYVFVLKIGQSETGIACTFQSSPLNLLVQLELYFVEMMFRSSSTKIYSFQFEQTKNGILISY